MNYRFFLSVLLSFVLTGSLSARRLGEAVDSLISVTGFLKTSEVGVAVYDLNEGRFLYRCNSQKLFRPASTQKVITAVTALSLLGEDFCFKTSLVCSGDIVGDSLLGDLLVVGGLDPLFSDDDMNSLVDKLYNKGIRHISGNLVPDVSLMDSIYWGAGWSWDDAPGYYQPYVSPLMLNSGYVDVSVSPSSRGSRPKVKVTPSSPFYSVNNQALSITPSAGKLEVSRNWLEGGNEIVVTGNCSSPYNCKLSIFRSSDFFVTTLLSRLNSKGITVSGSDIGIARFACDSVETSTDLSSVMEKALKKSDNLCAESMFIMMGSRLPDSPKTSFSQGAEAVRMYMQDVLQRSPDDCSVNDGSGLSPYNLVSPELMIDYLRLGAGNKLFLSSLPVAGVDGTLRNRMKSGKACGNVRAKTGSVTGVSALAGYALQTSSGHLLAFVIFNQNFLKSKDARNFQDKLCELLCK